MVCPNCMEDRNFWGSHCHHCTHEVSYEEQMIWSFTLFLLKAVAFIFILWLFS